MTISIKLGEFEEFAVALFEQLSAEINAEKEIVKLADKAKESIPFKVKFEELEKISQKLFPELKKKAEGFLGIKISDGLKIEFPDLIELKKIKGEKIFSDEKSTEYVRELFDAVANEDNQTIVKLMQRDMAKYLVFSTYAIQYISKISTTYGDYLDSVIYLNKFILSRYPLIILYRQGEPFEEGFENVNSSYLGAVKYTIISRLIHSAQKKLEQLYKNSAMQVNLINEELARIILDLDNQSANILSDYLQIQDVPDEFPFTKKANLFFFLNPDHFLLEQIGTDVMTLTNVEIDPKISEIIPQISDIYKRWLQPIQQSYESFTILEGMAEFVTENILKDDNDFQNYQDTFRDKDSSTYKIRQNTGKEFTKICYEKFGRSSFRHIMENPPTASEIKEPQLYLKSSRVKI